MARAMHIRLSEILDAVKVEELQAPSAELSLFGKNIHECGTARMGADPKKSVVNRFNQVHDAKNVFVTDGACFVTQGCYEPTLTIMAISLRAAEHLAAEFQRGNL
jgi:choline dehydrogenase-like flavoprotein